MIKGVSIFDLRAPKAEFLPERSKNGRFAARSKQRNVQQVHDGREEAASSDDVAASSDASASSETDAAPKNQAKLVEKIRKVEKSYFERLREEEQAFYKYLRGQFRVCRVCLTPATDTKLSNAFDDSAKFAQMLKLVANVDVFKDYEKHECLICNRCSRDLEAAYEFDYKKPPTRAPKVFLKVEERNQSEESSQGKASASRNRKIGVRRSERQKIMQERIRQSQKLRSWKEKRLKEQPSKTFKCQICWMAFGIKSNLKLHVDAVHLRVKKVEREILEQKFQPRFNPKLWSILPKRNSEQHLQHDHIEISPKIEPKAVNLKPNLVIDPVRPFRCTFEGCTKDFKQKKHLKSHLRSHSDARDFECSCGKTYKYPQGLRQHQKTKHH